MKKILLILATILLMTISMVSAQTLVDSDDFNRSDTTGNSNTDLGSNWVQWHNPSPPYPDKWMYIDNQELQTGSAITEIIGHYIGYTDLTTLSRIDFRWKQDTNLAGKNFAQMLGTTNSGLVDGLFMGIRCGSSGGSDQAIMCQNGSTWISLVAWGSFVPNKYYNLSLRNINWVAQTFEVYLDDVDYGEFYWLNSGAEHHILHYSKTSSHSGTYTFNMDDLEFYGEPVIPPPEYPELGIVEYFVDDFNRADNDSIGNDWWEVHEINAPPPSWKIANNTLEFSDLVDGGEVELHLYPGGQNGNYSTITQLDWRLKLDRNMAGKNFAIQVRGCNQLSETGQLDLCLSPIFNFGSTTGGSSALTCGSSQQLLTWGSFVVDKYYNLSFRNINWQTGDADVYMDDVFQLNCNVGTTSAPNYISFKGKGATGPLTPFVANVEDFALYVAVHGTDDNFDRQDTINISQSYNGDLEFQEIPKYQTYTTAPYDGDNETVLQDGEMVIYDSSYCDAHAVVVGMGNTNEFVDYADGNMTFQIRNGVTAGSSENWENYVGFGENLDEYVAQEIDCPGTSLVTMFDPFDRTYGTDNKRFCKVSYVGSTSLKDKIAIDCGGTVMYLNLTDANNEKQHYFTFSFDVPNDKVKIWLNGYYQGEYDADDWMDNPAKINTVAFVTKTNQGGVTQYMAVDDLVFNVEEVITNLTLYTDLVDGTYDYNAQNITINYNGTYTGDPIFNCSLYVDSALNQTDSDINITQNQDFFVSWGDKEADTTFKIECENAETSAETITYHYIVDTVEPRITTNFIPYSIYQVRLLEDISFNVSVYDEFLTITNVSLEHVNGSILDNYYNDTHNDTGTQTHLESLYYNASVLGTGNYTFRVYGKNYVNENEKTYPFEVQRCPENWYPLTTECSLFNYTQTLYYEDLNECGTTYDLPADNGTTIPCTVGYCNTTQITSEGRGKSENWIYENDCVQMVMSKHYYTPTITLIDKIHTGTFKLMLFGIEERDNLTSAKQYRPFASMKLQSNISGGYLRYENEMVDIGYVINESKFKTVMTVRNYDYRLPGSDLWVKILYKKGAEQYIQYVAPIVDNVTKDLVVEFEETGVNTWAWQNIYNGDIIDMDPIIACLENWEVQYTSCTIGDNRTKYYIDSNACGTVGDLPVDNSTLVTCNYCSADWQYDETACVEWSLDIYPTIDLNESSCCNVTGIPTDCDTPANTSQSCVGIHGASDVPAVVVDNLMELGIEGINYVPIIVIILGIVAIAGIILI